jgi:hypothetical protein
MKLVVKRLLLVCSDPAIREEAATFMAAYTLGNSAGNCG